MPWGTREPRKPPGSRASGERRVSAPAAPRKGPTLDPTAWIAPGAVVIGDVTLGARASVWYQAVLRGDTDPISVGDDSNLQDGVVVHVDEGQPARIGARVTVGHAAIVHGCTIEDECLIGMGAIVLNGARVGTGSIVAAGALVTEGMQVPPGSVVMGMPGKVRREATAEDRARIQRHADSYIMYRQIYLDEEAGAE
jgi:carbonic anhydrase/acetyltransferase-like protein (isoleucine patch superfamily)